MIGQVFNLKQLEALVWVAKLGSFRKAADHLGTTQPNISTRIAALEKTLDVILMDRDAGSVTLTDKGRDILAAAQDTLRQAEQIITIAGRPDLVADRLRLGVTELVACTWLHDFLRQIKAVYPALNVELTVDLSHTLDTEFRANRLDLAIQTAPFASPASGVVALGSFPYIWVAGPTVAQHVMGRHTIADLVPHAILTHARHTQAFAELMDHAKANAVPTSRVVSSSSLASCVQMAADGMGVTLLPAALVKSQIAAGALRVVDVDWHPSPLRFAARYQSHKAPQYLIACAQMASQAAAFYTEDI